MNKRKILIACQDIRNQGGIATAAVNLLCNINPDKYNVSLIVISGHIGDKVVLPPYVKLLPPPSTYRDMFGYRSDYRKLPILKQIVAYTRRLYKIVFGIESALKLALTSYKVSGDYDAAVAFYDQTYNEKGHVIIGGDYDLIRICVTAKKKIAWVHNDPYRLRYTKEIALREFAEFDAFVNVSYDCKSKMDEICPELKHKSFVVYNTYDIENIKKQAVSFNPYKGDKLRFVTVCRLEESQKKISRIVKACSKLKSDGYTDFMWSLVGSGDSDYYKSLAKNLDVDDIIQFEGMQKNPYPYMKYADAFILSSQYEGLSMTMRESQICGTPTFTTNVGSANEAVKDGFQGEICENSSNGVYLMIKGILDNRSKLQFYRKYLKENPITNELAMEQFYNICEL